MVRNQKCNSCRSQFAENAPELNYALFAQFGFATENDFRKHSSRNPKCPCKVVHTAPAQPMAADDELIDAMQTMTIRDWGAYLPGVNMSEEDYADNQEMTELKLRKHMRGGRALWFENSVEAAYLILNEILNPETQFITLVAEPGAGKTAVIHNLLYLISKLPYEKAINPNNITITTGMSDTEWYSQLIDNLTLLKPDSTGPAHIWEALYSRDQTYCVTHRSNFHKRITWLLNNPQHLSNHVFQIDEHHIADEPDMTIDNEFRRLGLTEEKMKEYNIKIINISATPDVSLSIMTRKDNHKMVILRSGEGYKGFDYFMENDMLIDYANLEIESVIRVRYTAPRYHYVRARTQTEKGAFRSNIIEVCRRNDWSIIEDDSSNKCYLSFADDAVEKMNRDMGLRIVKTYVSPEKHTIILIKNKYPASKRLKITPYTGVVLEKPADAMNTTVTCNGLIPRFWGYGELPAFPHNQKPLFICNKKSVDEYVKFKQDFVYNGTSYTSIRIKSDESRVKELGTTWCANMVGILPATSDNRIGIQEFDSVDMIAEFLRGVGFENVREIAEFGRGPNGYCYPRRNPEHSSEEMRLTQEIYNTKFVRNGGGTHVNRQWPNGSGQPYMIWPVYETMESPATEVKYYVHYLILENTAI